MSIEENRKKIAALIKEKPTVPLQEVKPTSTKREGFHINAWIDQNLEKPVKQYCLDHDMTIKEFLTQAIDEKLRRK